MNKAIGIFDSGVGGLTVAKQIINTLPHEDIIYFGDSLRAPYGSRSASELQQFSRQILDFLLSYKVKALVVACGTISARVFDCTANMAGDVPIIGMVEPGVTEALNATKTGRIGVIATEGTIESKAHEKAILAVKQGYSVTSVSCPLFVPLAEEGWVDNEVADLTAKIYLSGLASAGIDTLVLGCTHYPLLIKSIKKAVGDGVSIIDPAASLANRLKCMLEEKSLLKEDGKPEYNFYVSGSKEKFDKMMALVLGKSYMSEVVRL